METRHSRPEYPHEQNRVHDVLGCFFEKFVVLHRGASDSEGIQVGNYAKMLRPWWNKRKAFNERESVRAIEDLTSFLVHTPTDQEETESGKAVIASVR